MKRIWPGLLSYSIDEKWQENTISDFGSSPKVRWVVSFEVLLFDHHSREALRRSSWERFKSNHPEWLTNKYNRDGMVGELFGFIVCSPAFKRSPTANYEPLISRAFIQDVFDQNSAIEYLKSKIDAIGDQDVENAGSYFREFLETEEWDYDTNKTDAS